MASNKIKLKARALKPFFKSNPAVDILHFDFHDREAVSKLNWNGADRARHTNELKAYQRLLRIHPDEKIAEKLKARGIDSARKIAALPEHQFIRDYLDVFDGNEDQAKQVHRRGVHIKTTVNHMYGAIKDMVASPHYRAAAFCNTHASVDEYYKNIPSYQDLFGSLDYLECGHCQSIFSPAAYFLDIMRIADEYITDPNLKPLRKIPPGYTLEERRPDLFNLKLTCANTNTIIPFLEVVNRVLEKNIEAREKIEDCYQTLALAPYPFNLPYNLPLNQLRVNLDKMGTALAQLYERFEAADGTAEAVQPLDVRREKTGLSVTQMSLVTSPDPGSGNLSRCYGYNIPIQPPDFTGSGNPGPRAGTIDDYLPSKGTGTIAFKKDEKSAVGSGTKFTAELRVGDQIRAAQNTRTVTAVVSDTQLEVNTSWSLTTQGTPFTILKSDGLDVVDIFLARTDLTQEKLQSLFTQNLSTGELDSGRADQLFINNTGEGLPRLRTYFAYDPANPVQRIEGLSLKRLDRLSRFIRLARISGQDYPELDWAMKAADCTEITAKFITSLGDIKTLSGNTGLDVEELTACWHDMKTVGKVNDSDPQDFFDRIYNDPALLHGENPYQSQTVPFDPFRTPPQSWHIDNIEGDNGIIRNRLRAALAVNDGDLTKAARFVLSLSGKGQSDPLALNLANLTCLYRITRLADCLTVTLDEYLNLVGLLFYPERDYLDPGPEGCPADADALYTILATAAWLKESPFTIYQLKYACKGDGSPYFEPAYNPDDIRRFINNLAVTAEGSRLQPDSLKVGDISGEQADQVWQTLKKEKVISDLGIFKKYAFSYNDTCRLVPVEQYGTEWVTGFDARSFSTPFNRITGPESAKVFTALTGHKPPILISTGEEPVTLNRDFDEHTDLGFLESILTEDKIQEVRRILLQVRTDIYLLADVLSKIEKMQADNLLKGLSEFLNTGPETVDGLVPIGRRQSGLADYLVGFLTPLPPESPLPKHTADFIEIISRWTQVVDSLHLDTEETLYITSEDGAPHFNIDNLAKITVQNIRSISLYKGLANNFNDRQHQLIRYFQTPAGQPCPGNKIGILADLTGWDADQVCRLIQYFWPEGSDVKDDFDTTAGLVRLEACFDLGRLLGADMEVLLEFTGLAHLPLAGSGGKIIKENWAVYERLAQAGLNLVGSRYKDSRFKEVNRELTSKINSRSRDALLGYALWLINAENPAIVNPSDLYQYLLIDVEMSGCADTSLIAQAIASVQLYMQRCRMMLEPGVTVIKVPEIWWSWMSNYRIWEVNRKIFLYPENYIDPSLRKNATPDFKELSQNLQMNDITRDNVVKPFEKYFQNLSVLGSLVHVASCHCNRTDHDTGEEKETLFLFGRTSTQPYTYYFRTLDDRITWGAWQEIKLSIASRFVSPVFAFGRIFIFWTEFDVGKSNSIKNQESNTETVNKATVKFSFYNQGEWVEPQVLYQDAVINAFPVNYPSIDNNDIQEILNSDNHFWREPYVLSSGAGVVGAGTVDLTADLGIVNGTHTQFDREVRVGDRIRCMGEERVVGAVQDAFTLVVTYPWTTGTSQAEYKIVPAEKFARLESFIGQGTVDITAGLQLVSGNNTRFLDELVYGDKITCGDEIRWVIQIQNDTEILVDRPWQSSSTGINYTVVPRRNINESIMVLYGAALKTSYSQKFVPPPDYSNPTQDTFLEQRNEFNHELYDSLRVAKKASPEMENIPGVVTVGPATLLDANLIKTDTRLLIADDQFTAKNNPVPYKADLNRNQGRLKVQPGKNSIVNNYWGNNLPDLHDSSRPDDQSKGVDLLYYIAEEKSSLINVANQPGWFLFNNSDEAFLVRAQEKGLNKLSDIVYMRPLPIPPDMLQNMIVSSGAYIVKPEPLDKIKFEFTRLTTKTIPQLYQRLFAGGIDNLLSLDSQQLPELPFNRFYPPPGSQPPASVIPPQTDKMDFSGAFGIYFWEIFFHAPFLVAARLNGNKRYEDAALWLQYIFNPTQPPSGEEEPTSGDRFWRFLPFRSMERESLEEILTDKIQIRRYNFSPFDPDAIAALRYSAYAKAVVMRYIDNLLDWGDYLFSQDTRESINQATNLYVMASDILGKRPRSKGKIPPPDPRSFNEIKAVYHDHIPQFLIDLENAGGQQWQESEVQYADVPFNDINSYFCVPENADFMKYWDRVEDRLYKIRHCMNIKGIVRSLPLFEPPIEPGALIRAMAAGGIGISLSSQLGQPVPFYRSSFLLEKAKALTNQLSSLGASLLSALEKQDAEALNLLRNQQERAILNLTTTIKEQEIEEAKTARKALEESLASATYRKSHYADLIKTGISEKEQKSLDAMLAALVFNVLGTVTKTAASIGYAVPQAGSPFAMTYGGQQIGNALNAASGVLEIGATISNFISQQALTMAGYERRSQEWSLQESIAAFDVDQINAQIKANDIRQAIAEQALNIHQESIKQNEDIELFLKDKFTSRELYQWLCNRLSAVYFQTYTLAYDMAMAAQKAFQYEYNTEQSFINFGYWDDLRKGLGAAEGLMLALSQMEKACLDRGGRSLEIEKTISLLQLNPRALLDLRDKGECLFELTEKLFDYDFPGHYARKIKSISISIPAVVGPYQNIKATLVQMSNQVVIQAGEAGVDAVNFLLGGKGAKTPPADVLRSNWWVNQQVALSKGIDDSGMFELNFNDSRYLPFEGTGAVSAWKLSMPKATNRINFDAVSDVIINLKYSAVDGGASFREKVCALAALKPYSGVGYLDLRQMYATDWYRFLHDHSSEEEQAITFKPENFVPPQVESATLRGFYFKLTAAGSAPGSYITFQVTDTLSVDITLAEDNSFSYDFKEAGQQPPRVEQVINKSRKIGFNLNQTPSSLKTADRKFLNPDAVEDIELILYYDGAVNFQSND